MNEISSCDWELRKSFRWPQRILETLFESDRCQQRLPSQAYLGFPNVKFRTVTDRIFLRRTTFLMFRPKFVFIDKNKWQRSAVIIGCSYHWGEPIMITMSRWVLRSNEIEKVSCACKIKKTSNESLIDLMTMMCEKEDFEFNAQLIDLKWTRLDDNRSIRRNVSRYKQICCVEAISKFSLQDEIYDSTLKATRLQFPVAVESRKFHRNSVDQRTKKLDPLCGVNGINLISAT